MTFEAIEASAVRQQWTVSKIGTWWVFAAPGGATVTFPGPKDNALQLLVLEGLLQAHGWDRKR